LALTAAEALSHSHAGMTAHYLVALVLEIRDELEKIPERRTRITYSPRSSGRLAKSAVKSPPK